MIHGFSHQCNQYLRFLCDNTIPTQLDAEALLNTVFYLYKKIHYFLSYLKQILKLPSFRTTKINKINYNQGFDIQVVSSIWTEGITKANQ